MVREPSPSSRTTVAKRVDTPDLTSDSGGESSEDEIRKRCVIEGDDGPNGPHGVCTEDEDSEVLCKSSSGLSTLDEIPPDSDDEDEIRKRTDSGDETEEETSIPSHTDSAHFEDDPEK